MRRSPCRSFASASSSSPHFPKRRVWLRRRAAAQRTFLGCDWGRYRSDGVLVVPNEGAQWIALAAPDGVAAQRGIRAGDRLPEDVTPETLVAALREGAEIVVVRQNEDEVWVDTVLPAPDAPTEESP